MFKKRCGLICQVLASFLTSLSIGSFYWMPPCLSTHIMVSWFTSDSAVSFFIQSATSSDFVPFAPGAATATWLSVRTCEKDTLFAIPGSSYHSAQYSKFVLSYNTKPYFSASSPIAHQMSSRQTACRTFDYIQFPWTVLVCTKRVSNCRPKIW